jgi:hypothetical protein
MIAGCGKREKSEPWKLQNETLYKPSKSVWLSFQGKTTFYITEGFLWKKKGEVHL